MKDMNLLKSVSVIKFFTIDLLLFASASIFIYTYYGLTLITSTCKRFLINKKKIILLKCFGVPLKKNDTLHLERKIFGTVIGNERLSFNDWSNSIRK